MHARTHARRRQHAQSLGHGLLVSVLHAQAADVEPRRQVRAGRRVAGVRTLYPLALTARRSLVVCFALLIAVTVLGRKVAGSSGNGTAAADTLARGLLDKIDPFQAGARRFACAQRGLGGELGLSSPAALRGTCSPCYPDPLAQRRSACDAHPALCASAPDRVAAACRTRAWISTRTRAADGRATLRWHPASPATRCVCLTASPPSPMPSLWPSPRPSPMPSASSHTAISGAHARPTLPRDASASTHIHHRRALRERRAQIGFSQHGRDVHQQIMQ
jgi:hypothetical protein